MMSEELYNELISYLGSDKAFVIEDALKLVLSLTDDPTFIKITSNEPLITSFIKYLHRLLGAHPSYSHTTAKCLVNLSTDTSFAQRLIELNCIEICMENLREQIRSDAPLHKQLNLMILTNLTRHEEGIYKFLRVNVPNKNSTIISTISSNQQNNSNEIINKSKPQSSLHLLKLIVYFLSNPANQLEEDEYYFVSHILLNIATNQIGREELSKIDNKTMNALCREMKNQHRGETLCTFFKYICYSNEFQTFFSNEESEIIYLLMAFIYPQPIKPLSEREINPLFFSEMSNEDIENNNQSFSNNKIQNIIINSLVSFSQTNTKTQFLSPSDSNQICYLNPIVSKEASPFNYTDLSQKITFLDCLIELSKHLENRQIMRSAGIYEVLSCLYATIVDQSDFKLEIKRLVDVLKFPEEIQVNKLVNLSSFINDQL